jgi:two-component system copper resistance phosphate regulon response regulator CusR
MRLLLVEDELEIQSFVKQSLVETGYEVHTAEDAATASQLASKHA